MIFSLIELGQVAAAGGPAEQEARAGSARPEEQKIVGSRRACGGCVEIPLAGLHSEGLEPREWMQLLNWNTSYSTTRIGPISRLDWFIIIVS